MRKILLSAMIVCLLFSATSAYALTIDEKNAASSKRRVQALIDADNADTVDYFHAWEFVWDDSYDVGDLDILFWGLSPNRIYGTAWTMLNDGSGSGLNADYLDGYNASSFIQNNKKMVDNSDIADRTLAIRKIKGLKAALADLTTKYNALEARIATLENK